MCTSLIYRDAADKVYFGRTLELTVDLPYQVAYLPRGLALRSQVPGHAALDYTLAHAVLGVAMPVRAPTADAPLGLGDLKVLEGLNDKGLTFSLLSYPSAAGPQPDVDAAQAVLSASDLGTWVLGQFATVAEVRTALAAQPVKLEALPLLGGVVSPFHYAVHDASGASLVIEFHKGTLSVYDNPVGVMTNGPQFPWHLTNLDNYTYLSNVDQPVANFGAYRAMQPDAGIATSGLPASSTSVGRFVRAAFYAQYAEKTKTPDEAILMLGHVMNGFDRPRGVAIDYPQAGGASLEVQGLDANGEKGYETEYTSWTSLTDLGRLQFHVRDYQSLNYASLDLSVLKAQAQPRVLPLAQLRSAGAQATAQLAAA